MADRPAQEWQIDDKQTGTAAKQPDSLPLPNDPRLTLAQSRAMNIAGETADWLPDDQFYKVGPLTAKNPAPHSTDLIGGRHPQDALKLDTEDDGGVTVVRPLPGARRQLIDPDGDIKPNYDSQPKGF